MHKPLTLSILLVLALAPASVLARPQTSGLTLSAPVQAQSLADALEQISRDTGLQVLYTTSVDTGLRAGGLDAGLAVEAALVQLLRGTGLRHRFIDARTVTIEPASASDSVAAPAGSVTTIDGLQVRGYRVDSSAGGTRIVTPLKDLPMSVQVVNEELIQDLGARRIEDAIRFVSGINKVNRNDNLGRGERFAIRGFNSSLIMRNGVPYNAFTDTANIAQIDVVKGANSILYGFNDPGGLINYITREPQPTAAYAINQTIGSFDFYRTEADLTGPIGDRLEYRLTGAYTDAGSWLEHGMEKTWFVNPVLDIALGDNTELRLDLEYKRTDSRYQRDAYPALRDEQGVAFAYATQAGTRYSPIFPDDRNLIEVSNAEVRLTHHFGAASTLRLVGAQTRIDSDQFNMIGFAMEPGSERMLQRRNLLELNEQTTDFFFADLSSEFSLWGATHRVVAGAQHLYRGGRGFSRIGAFAPAIDILDPPDDPAIRHYRPETRDQLLQDMDWIRGAPTKSFGAFVTDQITLADDRTHILLGGRYDDLNGVSNFTPQAGVNYRLNDQVSAYALYSESFRLNAPYTYQDTGEVRTFPPEEGINQEVGLKLDLFDRRLSGTLALYNLSRENVVQVFATDNPFDPLINLSGKERSRGVELDLSGRIGERLRLFGSYAYTDSEILGSTNPALVGAPLEGVAKHALSLFAKYELGTVGIGELSVNAGYLWRQGPILLNTNTTADSGFSAGTYGVVDAGVDYVLGNGVSLSLKASNLLDEAYMDRRSAYAAPRRVNFNLRWVF